MTSDYERDATLGRQPACPLATELEAGELTPGDGARIGATDFDTWFATQQQSLRGAV
jgi:hypothetical protein